MKRFILSCEPDSKGRIVLSGKDYHYLVNVRRLAAAECFPCLCPSGKNVLLHVDSVDKGLLTASVMPDTFLPESPASGVPEQETLVLFQALPKGDKMDLIVRQAAECGISEIVPFISQHSVQGKKKPKKDVFEQKMLRWQKIIKEARQQSGSAAATLIREPVDIPGLFCIWEEFKEKHPQVLGLLLHQIPLEQDCLHSYLYKKQDLAVIVIGPEGGFSEKEVSGFLNAGFKPFWLGLNVLRTETAALYTAAAVQIIQKERDSWEMMRK